MLPTYQVAKLCCLLWGLEFCYSSEWIQFLTNGCYVSDRNGNPFLGPKHSVTEMLANEDRKTKVVIVESSFSGKKQFILCHSIKVLVTYGRDFSKRQNEYEVWNLNE